MKNFVLIFLIGVFSASCSRSPGSVRNKMSPPPYVEVELEDPPPPPRDRQLKPSDIQPISMPSETVFKSSGQLCEFDVLDLYFLVDSSDSVGRYNFASVRKYIQNRVQELSAASPQSRFGVIQFTNKSKVVYDLTTPAEKIADEILNLTYLHGRSSVRNAMIFTTLQHLRDWPTSSNVEKAMLILTDSKDDTDAYGFAALTGVKVMVVGVYREEDDIDWEVLTKIAGGNSDNVFDIKDHTNFVQILGLSCPSIPITSSCEQLQKYYTNQGLDVRDCTQWKDSLYWRFETKMSWHDAEEACNNVSGHLVSIHSFDEKSLVNDLGENNERGIMAGPWIGLYKRIFTWPYIFPLLLGCSDNSFQWSDGSELDYVDWAGTSPHCNRGQEACVQLVADIGMFGWNDNTCDKLKKSICKVKASTVV